MSAGRWCLDITPFLEGFPPLPPHVRHFYVLSFPQNSEDFSFYLNFHSYFLFFLLIFKFGRPQQSPLTSPIRATQFCVLSSHFIFNSLQHYFDDCDGATGDEDDNDCDDVTGYDDNDDGNGATGYDDIDDCDGATGDKDDNDCEGATGYDDDNDCDYGMGNDDDDDGDSAMDDDDDDDDGDGTTGYDDDDDGDGVTDDDNNDDGDSLFFLLIFEFGFIQIWAPLTVVPFVSYPRDLGNAERA